ncbi:hypothetical protein LEP1GSC123_0744 [Leptospira borgpetersenii str. 200701203]|uniref:Uncharacterized protein n=1 Tax=Leptospira borgpetersenii str. 200701203 TaxID=1193007 RepID=M3FK37_LEPBO|nr:hypothetical protein LEP1GSC123_0744 [Leptospira borgpetersenii str. 200701203]
MGAKPKENRFFFTSKKSKLSLFSFSEFIPIGKIWNPKTSNLPGI